ncbi:MAG: hypothetical protein L3J24_06695 [Xanthomonadales bacterium]|nr:hypothetical protein [Xanthomonadales bacterium]
MSKFKFLPTTAVFVLMLLSTGVVFADSDEEPAVELPRMVVNGQPIPPMSWADLQMLIARLQTGDNVIGGGGGGSGASDAQDEKEKYCEQSGLLSDLLQGVLTGSATPITGTAASGYSIAQGAYDAFKTIIDAAYRDIFWVFIRSSG